MSEVKALLKQDGKWIDAHEASLLQMQKRLERETQRLREELAAMTADRDLWRDEHNGDCPNMAVVKTLEQENAALKAQAARLWQGWKDDAETLVKVGEQLNRSEEENERLRAQVERLTAPVSDAEWNPYAWFDDGDDDKIGNMTRPQVNHLIAARASAEKEQG